MHIKILVKKKSIIRDPKVKLLRSRIYYRSGASLNEPTRFVKEIDRIGKS